MTLCRTMLLVLAVSISGWLQAQDTTVVLPVSPTYLTKVSSRADHLEQKLDKKSGKALQKLKRQEERIQKKLAGMDSSKAAALSIFGISVIYGNDPHDQEMIKQGFKYYNTNKNNLQEEEL